MSSSIDQRIVSMKFDNAQFEQGAKTSMGTLEKLKNSLNFSGSSKALDGLKNSVNSIDTSGAISGVEELGIRFSAMGIMAKRALENVTDTMMNKLGGAIRNTIGLIQSGGMRRALNLEQANFSMMGILGDAKKVAEVMGMDGPVQKAVEGTAYGLDAAALAASNLIATGMDISELGDPLKVISGIAAQTGKSYELMSDIILDTYAKNYVSGMEISRLQEQGINATAELSRYYKSLGKEVSADQISEMVRKKQIGAEDLTKALMHFYENAARANDTYTGSLANLKAALSRLGAKFYTPYLKNMRNIFNALRPMVNSISSMLDPIINKINSVLTKLSDAVVSKIEKMTKRIDVFKETIAKINFDSFKDFIISVEKLVNDDTSKKLREFFKNFFADEIQYDEFGNVIEDTRTKIEKLNDSFELTPYNKIVVGIDKIKRGFKDFGSGLSNIPGLLLSAFEGTSNYLPNFIDGFYNVAKVIREVGANFKEFFENFDVTLLKNTISIVANIFGILANSAATLVSTISKLLAPQFKYLTVMFKGVAAPLVTLVSNIANTIREFDLINLAIKKVADVISGILKPVSEWIYSRFFSYNGKPGLVYTLWDAVNYLSNGFENLAPKIADFLKTEHDFSSIGKTIVSVFSKIAEFLSPVGKKLSEIKDSMSSLSGEEDGLSVLDKLSNVLDRVGSVISMVASKITKGLGAIGNAIKETFTIPNITSMVTALSLFSSGGLIYKFNQFIAGFAWKRSDILGGPLHQILYSLELVSKSLVGTFRTLKESCQIKTIKEISTAILIFSAALLVLSMINPERLIAASFAAGAALAELMYSFERLTKHGKNSAGMFAVTSSLIAMSVALLILSAAMTKISKMDWDELSRGLVAVGAIMVMMAAYINLIADISRNQGKLVKSASTLIALALAIDLLVIAVKKLGEMDYNQLSQGLIGVSLLLAGLGIFQALSSLGTFKASSGVGLLALAGALVIMSSVIEDIGSLDPKVMASGLLAIGLALGEIALFSNVLSGAKVFIAAKAITAVSTAMWFISKALVAMAEVDPQRLAESLIMMTIALMGVVAALSLMPEKSSMSNAGAITLVATGMVILARALKILATIPMEKMVTALFGMGTALAIFAIAARSLKGVELTLLAIGAAMALWGAGIAALSVGITVLTPVLVVFASAWVTALEIVLDGIINMGGKIKDALSALFAAILGALDANKGSIVTFLVDLLLALLDLVIEYIPKFTERIGLLLDAMIVFITENVPKFVELGFVLLTSFLQGVADNIQQVVDLGFSIITSFLQGIADNIQQVVEIAITIVVNFINGIANQLPSVIDAGINLLLSFINGVATAIDTYSYQFGEAGWNLLSALVQGMIKAIAGFASHPIQSIRKLGSDMLKKLKEYINFDKAKQIAKNLIDGIVKGIKAFFDDPIGTIADLGSSLIDKFCNILGINSPSKEFNDAGSSIVDGLNNGLSNDSDPLNTVESLSKSLLSKFSNLLNPSATEGIGRNAIGGLNSGIKNQSPSVINSSTTLSNTIKNTLSENLAYGKFTPIGKNVVSGLGTGITNNSGSATKASKNAASAIKNGVTGTLNYDTFYGIGVNTMAGMEKGIINKANSVRSTVVNTANNIIRSMRSTMQIASPSKVFYGIGEYCMMGLSNAFGDDNRVITTIDRLGNAISDRISSRLDDINDSELTITPILDLSDIQNGASKINSILDPNRSYLGSIESSFTANNSDKTSNAINKLIDSINQRIDSEVSTADIFDAVKDGLSNATVVLRIGGREVTSIVNDINFDDIESRVSFLGGM